MKNLQGKKFSYSNAWKNRCDILNNNNINKYCNAFQIFQQLLWAMPNKKRTNRSVNYTVRNNLQEPHPPTPAKRK